MSEEDEQDPWADYSSEQLFPGCDCGHDATDHHYSWGDDREADGCTVEGCPCEIEWEHT